MLKKTEGKEKITNLVAKLMMQVCVFLFDSYDILILEFLQSHIFYAYFVE